MAHEVYANSNEIAGNATTNKVIASFPDVCLSPPSPPAGPIPVPYPNTSFSSDLKEGSQSVKLGGKGAALAQQSYYKVDMLGDEAATRTFGANIITHQITGKTYFQAWSMDVKIEGKNACRHTDITTSNHASHIGGASVPNPGIDAASFAKILAGNCPCCDGPLHPNQVGGTPVTEKQWYGIDDARKGQLNNDLAKAKADSTSLHRKTARGARDDAKRIEGELSQIADTEFWLNEGRSATPPCPNVPATPDKDCGVYFAQSSSNAVQAANKAWSPDDPTIPGFRDDYVAWYNASKPRSINHGEKINHATPISGGGCPRGGNPGNGYANLSATDDIGGKGGPCDQIDDNLTPIQHSVHQKLWEKGP